MASDGDGEAADIERSASIGYTGSDREGKGPSLIERFLRIFSPEK